MPNKKTFQINGIHCASCKTLIEEEVKAINKVKDISVNHLTGETTLDFDGDINEVYETIESLGYKITAKKISNNKNNEDKKSKFLIPIIAIAIFIIFYFLIQKFELFNIMSQLNESSIGYGTIIIIGILASFHCIGMCGGLVITYSASSTKENISILHSPHLHYNLGRLISYTIIGGILGGFGAFFGINPNFAGVTTIIVAIFMILMGVSLFSEHSLLNKIKLNTPQFIAKFIFKNKHDKKPKSPFVIGILTGFMPCGPLQAMQLFALASGSIFSGAMAMFLYSLGTIPLMLGFGAMISSFAREKTKVIMKVSGVLIILLGLMMINRGLINFGSGINFSNQKKPTEIKNDSLTIETQIVEMAVTYSGYSPNVLKIKKGQPVKWIIKDKGITGCTNSIKLYLPEGTIQKDLKQKGETIIEFTPTKAGEIKFSCWMSMVWGKFIVE